MLRAEVAIEHEGCWASEISVCFPRLQLLLLDTVSIDPKTSTVILYAWSEETNEFKGLLAYLAGKKRGKAIHVLDFEVLEKRPNSIFVRVSSEVRGSLIRRIAASNCFVAEPARLKGGEEVWTITTTAKLNIRRLLKAFNKVGKARLVAVKEVAFEKPRLTDKQKEALRTAFSLGYYSWPRKANLLKVAAKMKLSNAALRERLRKAESKLVGERIDWI